MFFLLFVATFTTVFGTPPHLSGKIVGGQSVDIQYYPYQLSLLYRGRHICGASIISQNFALTAGHCTVGVTANTLTVRAGSSYIGQGGQLIQVQNINRHPNFNSYDIDYDLSVLELAQYLTLTTHSYPIPLIEADVEIPEGTIATITGWGVTSEGGYALAETLQVVQVPIISREMCRNEYANFKLTERMICAGVANGGKDACQGDSGGPMVVDNKLTGVISWGYGCARPEYPGVYSNISSMRDFIKNVTGF